MLVCVQESVQQAATLQFSISYGLLIPCKICQPPGTLCTPLVVLHQFKFQKRCIRHQGEQS